MSRLALFLPVLGCAAATPASEPAPTWIETTQSAVLAGQYQPVRDGDGFVADNAAQDFRATFARGGLRVGDLGLRLRSWGREGDIQSVEPASPEAGECLVGGATDPFGECLRRIEYAHPGLVEWWENRPEGLEHGYTVSAAVDGKGPLVFDLAVDGSALVEDAGTAAVLGGFRYAGLVAWDERGTDLPAWMEPIPGGLRLVVDDEGALGTITVDPLLSSAAWTAQSDGDGGYFGFSAGSAGDVNGDGYDDIAVGAHRLDTTANNAGRGYVYLGSAAGPSTTAAWTADGDDGSGQYAYAIASAGDLNGDGFDDLAVSAPNYDATGDTDRGRIYVHYGSAAGPSSAADWMVEGEMDGAFLGISITTAGDVNADGYADLVVGAYGYTGDLAQEGQARLYLGSATGLGSTPDWTALGGQAEAYFGCDVSAAGDVNGDGYDDVIVGAYLHGEADFQENEGKAYVYLGSPTGLAATPIWTAEPDQELSQFGRAVSDAGDVNGDGYDDVIVGAARFDNTLDGNEGRAYVFLGSSAGPEVLPSWMVSSGQVDANVGGSVSGAGDVNGDGYDDVVVGVAGADSADGLLVDEGFAYVYDGSPTGLSTSHSWQGAGGQAGGAYGSAVSAAGDVNGDGYDDVIVGAYLYDDGNTDEGAAWLYYGSGDDGDGDGVETPTDCDDDDATVGGPTTRHRDADGDGYGEAAGQEVCPDEAGFVDDATDCDDADADIHPGADEWCNDVDDDCDGEVDEDAYDAPTWYADADGDTYTDPDVSQVGCDQPAGYAAATDDDDCDDTDPAIHPGATDIAGDDVDQDCNGQDNYDVNQDTGCPPPTGECGCATGTPASALWLALPVGLLLRRKSAR